MEMLIEPSARMRKQYNTIAELCRTTGLPVFLTKNGAGDLAAVSIEDYYRRDWMILLREELVRIEKQRRKGEKDLPAAAVCRRLYEVIENYKLLPLTEESEYPERDWSGKGGMPK